MLAREISDRYRGRVRFVVENWGDSPLAARLGVAQYPAVFVNDAVFATPRDLGFYGKTREGGRYTPWLDPESHARFREDLVRMVERALAGEALASSTSATAADAGNALTALPAFRVTDLAGKPLAAEDLRNRVVLVEFWATWCPPCQSTLEFLDALARERKDLAIVAFAVESEEPDVRARAAKLEGVRVALGSPEVASAFGDLLAVPTLYLFSPEGKVVATFYGSPPDLHDRVGRSIDALGVESSSGRPATPRRLSSTLTAAAGERRRSSVGRASPGGDAGPRRWRIRR